MYAFSGATGAQLWMTMEPPYPNERQWIASFGTFLDGIHDLDGDGRRDLLVSAPWHDYDPGDPYVLAGVAYILSGATGAVLRTHTSPTPLDGGSFGGTIAAVGDQDGDAREDYVVGERGTSRIFLFSGQAGTLIRTIPSPADEPYGGFFTFAHVDDRDGDGKDDFWVGAFKSGRISLLNGAGTLLTDVADPTPGGGEFGRALARTGDLDGDGGPDVVAGEPKDGTGKAFLILPNHPPSADAGVDRTVSANASCLGQVTLDGTGSSDPDGDALTYVWTGSFGAATGATPTVLLPLGIHVITLTVDDGKGATGTDTVQVTVVDTTAPVIDSASASPAVLWPPHHQLVPVTVALSVSDACGPAPACGLVSITSNEPENGLGDGDAAPDAVITGALSAELRAERAGTGSGRVYALGLECTDASLNSAFATATVTVPQGP